MVWVSINYDTEIYEAWTSTVDDTLLPEWGEVVLEDIPGRAFLNMDLLVYDDDFVEANDLMGTISVGVGPSLFNHLEQTVCTSDDRICITLQIRSADFGGGPDILEGHEEFDFCYDESGLNLSNAAWLAFLSSAEYAHYVYLGPLLAELGFGNPVEWTDEEGDDVSEGDAWRECGYDLFWLRHVEDLGQIPSDPEAWYREQDGIYASCAYRWYLDQIEGGTFPFDFADAFESYLLTHPRDEARIQFFSGGEYSLDGSTAVEGSTQMVWIQHSTLPLVILVFRGTSEDGLFCGLEFCDDWAANLSIFTEAFSEFDDSSWGDVHGGFSEAFASVNEAVEEKLLYLAENHPEVSIWVTGHSLGGARQQWRQLVLWNVSRTTRATRTSTFSGCLPSEVHAWVTRSSTRSSTKSPLGSVSRPGGSSMGTTSSHGYQGSGTASSTSECLSIWVSTRTRSA